MTFAQEIAARTLYGEARGETDPGQSAVARVLVNRMRDGRWGNTLTTVCMWPFQFSCWLPRDPNLKKIISLPDDDPMLEKLRGLVAEALASTKDPTQGATHYYAVSMIKAPAWSAGATLCGQIGNHLFYRDVK